MALMEGHKQRLNEGLIFFKATNDIERAGDEYTTVKYSENRHRFYDGKLPFDIPADSEVIPMTEGYKGNTVVVGLMVQSHKKVLVDEITDYDVQRVVRGLIAKEVSKTTGRYVSDYNIDCKLTKLYLEEKLTWNEYVESVSSNC